MENKNNDKNIQETLQKMNELNKRLEESKRVREAAKTREVGKAREAGKAGKTTDTGNLNRASQLNQDAYIDLLEKQERENRRRQIAQFSKAETKQDEERAASSLEQQGENIRKQYEKQHYERLKKEKELELEKQKEEQLKREVERQKELEEYERERKYEEQRRLRQLDEQSQSNNEASTKYEEQQNQSLTKKEQRAKKRAEKKKRKRQKSFTGRLINARDKLHTAEFILLMPFAIILDTLNMVKNVILGVFVICLVTGIIGGLFIWSKVKPYYDEYSAYAKNVVSACDLNTFMMQEPTYIYDSNGGLLIRLRGNQDSSYLAYEEIPTQVVNAFIAVEDRSFWDNPGFDLKGIIRVGVDYIKTKGAEKHGASTITQQLARTIFLTREVSMERKGKEILIALELTNKFEKKQIMEFYVNDVCFANALYGIQAAAKGYFNKNAYELTLSEIAYLCAIPNSPEYYNPYKYPERAITRRDKILDDMLELGYITDSECASAKREKITIEKPEYEFEDYMATYAIDCATRYLMKEQGFDFRYKFDNMDDYKEYKKTYRDVYDTAKDKLYTGGYKIYTTLDPNVQASMQEILDKNLSFDQNLSETGIYELQGAITVIDNDTGKVLAVVGGRSQEETEEDSKIQSLNRAFQSFRQPGSTIKPLAVYTPSLTMGYNPNKTVYNIDVSEAKKKGTDVQSLRGQSMTLRSALEQSKNGVAWQIFDDITPSYGLSFLEKMQFSKLCPDDYFNATALGGMTYGVNTVEMAGAYCTLQNHGYFREPTCLKRIIDRNDKDIYGQEASEQISVYDEFSADTMIDMMQGVLTKGTAAKLGWGKQTKMAAACKTGTTNDSKDGWLCGVTPYYTIAVWVGYDQPRTLSNLYGATYPGNIWKDAMLKMIEDKEVVEEFEKTGEFREYEDELSEEAMDEKYLPGRLPDEELSSGYTVGDYREDRVKGEQIPVIIGQMNALDRTSPQFVEQLNALYAQGQQVISTIYSRKYTAELKGQLDTAYTNKANGLVP